MENNRYGIKQKVVLTIAIILIPGAIPAILAATIYKNRKKILSYFKKNTKEEDEV
jgi:hypothetical protein